MTTPSALLMLGNDIIRSRLTGMLKASGWAIFETTSAVVGMDIAKRRSPDLILLDVTTSGLDADRMARTFKSDAITCMIPVIAVSDAERPLNLREPWAIDSISATTTQPILLAKLKNAMRQRLKRPFVLIVDDEPDLVDFLETALTREGYVASGASNGMEALEIIRAVQPDAILLDLDMPLLNGWDFLNQVRLGPGLGNTKVIILTGKDQTLEDRQHGLKLGACNYLLKPSDPDEIVSAIDSALEPEPDDEEEDE